MNGLIRASLGNPYAVTVMSLTLIILGVLSLTMIPIDILPVFKSPAVQTLTFYGGMSADSIANDISNRMERWTGQANGTLRQESRSIIGASIVRNYFQGDVDPNGALTQVNSLALGVIPNLPPGTLPPVVLPFDPTAMIPVCIVAVDSRNPANNESVLYDVGRYEVRNMIMGIPGAVAPVVYGGKVRAVMAYLDREKMQARGFSPVDVMNALDAANVFLPSGDAKIGKLDYVLDSNSMYRDIADMGDIPLRYDNGRAVFLRDVATPADANYIQTNVVRVNGKREVYIPVYRQLGASTLAVVTKVKAALKGMEEKVTKSGISLKPVMDQSIYVRKSIEALVQEGVLGAILCSLVILLFLGQLRMTAIAIMTLPISVLAASAALYFSGATINVMTLAGMTMAIGPMIDSAIICLENTHRHLGLGATPHEAAYLGASEVAMPELVSTLCTFLVLAPLVLTPGLGQFLFKPMAMAVAFSMIAAYILSRTLVPACSAYWLKAHEASGGHGAAGDAARGAAEPATSHARPQTFEINGNGGHQSRRPGVLRRAFARWEHMIDQAIAGYSRLLDVVLRHPILTLGGAFGALSITLALMWPILRRDFYPEVDAGAFEMYVRAPSGLRIEETEKRIKAVEDFVHHNIGEDVDLILSELGVNSDWSAAYTPNAGPMDAVVKIQLTEDRKKTAQEYVHILRTAFAADMSFSDLEFAFDAGGMVRSAMNEGKSTPISIRVTGKQQSTANQIATAIRNEVKKIDGVVDARVIQRQDYPEYVINVDRAKAAELGLTQEAVMNNVVAAFNSSIQFNKTNFWIDPKNKNQYFVGVQYYEQDIQSIETLLNIPITTNRPDQPKLPIPLRTVVSLEKMSVPTEVTHYNIQPTIEVTLGVYGRDLGHVSDDVTKVLDHFGTQDEPGIWSPYDPASKEKIRLPGSTIQLSGEYLRMNETFNSLLFSFRGLPLSALLIYFLMVGLDKSFVVPLSVISIVPLCLIGILPMLYLTGSAVNVQSLLGFIFIVGIKVANSVLMTDYAQELRRHEGLTPLEAIRKAAALRVRPITMTALAAFFALIPGALAIEQGSEANAPLARAILGGLLAGEPATLFVLPVVYSLIVRDSPKQRAERAAREQAAGAPAADPPPGAGWDEHD
jgi:multidrug efflux pump subunit AcrB